MLTENFVEKFYQTFSSNKNIYEKNYETFFYLTNVVLQVCNTIKRTKFSLKPKVIMLMS